MVSSSVSRRQFLHSMASTGALLTLSLTNLKAEQPPNILLIFCDDLGYGDLGTFGHPTIRTPILDRMAAEGQKWTNFYAADSVCTPSRAGLLTGRLPIRSGMCSDVRRVLFPDSAGGLPADEITIAEMLKTAGYRTACIGKWHLGHLPQYLPRQHGFDYYFGIPYSNDMDKVRNLSVDEQMEPEPAFYNVPLIRNEEIIERPTEQHTLTQRYTHEAVEFITENKAHPWFVYLAHTMVHIPLFASATFEGSSRAGRYGDVVEEIDSSIGILLRTLQEMQLMDNTCVIFTSDNGPWLQFKQHGGSAGLLREGKGTTWEGGMREPTIFYWPGKIKPAVISDIGSTLDLFVTIAALAGTELPQDRIMDSYDLSPTLLNQAPSPRREMFYYRGQQLYAIRRDAYKMHLITENEYKADNQRTIHQPPLLYNVDVDPGEHYDISSHHPEIIAELKTIVHEHTKSLIKGKDQLVKRITSP